MNIISDNHDSSRNHMQKYKLGRICIAMGIRFLDQVFNNS